jgi:hypothetical protein
MSTKLVVQKVHHCLSAILVAQDYNFKTVSGSFSIPSIFFDTKKKIMSKFLSIISLILVLYDNYAQYAPKKPFEKLSFEGIDPVYHYTFHDPDFRERDSDGYNCFSDLLTVKSLAHQNLLFLIDYNSIGLSLGRFGNYYVTCFNLDNGQMVWTHKVFLKDVKHIEIPRLMRINQRNELEILGQKNVTPGEGPNDFNDLILYRRTINLSDGSLIDLSHRAYDDLDAYHTKYQLLEFTLFLEESDGNIKFVEKFEDNGKIGYKSFLLDKTGKIQGKPDTMMYAYFDGFVNNVNIAPIGKDSMLIIEIEATDSSALIVLRYLTNDLKLIDEIKITSPVDDDLINLRLIDVSPDRDKILLGVYVNESAEFPEHALRMILDRSGNILNSARIEGNFSTFPEWYKTNSFKSHRTVSGINELIPDQNAIEFTAYSSDFSTTVLREHRIVDTTKIAVMADKFIYKGNEIVILSELAFYYDTKNFGYRRDGNAIAKSILSFKKGDFLPEGFLSTLTEEEKLISEQSYVTTHPNPSAGPLTLDIRGITDPVDIHIYDIMGRDVYVHHGAHDGETTLDLHDLPRGLYVYKIYSDRREISSGKWVRE